MGMKHLPISLIYLRLVIGFILIALSVTSPEAYRQFAILLVFVGLVSDILDGIVARRLNISSEKLRRMDSIIDQIFWCLVIISIFIRSSTFFHTHLLQIGLLLAAEALTYVISFVRFRREVATHAISSKIWTLFLFATLIELINSGDSGWIFQCCFYIGIITRLEIIAILLLLRQWTNDVPSVVHAIRLRQGKSIKRHKLFNG